MLGENATGCIMVSPLGFKQKQNTRQTKDKKMKTKCSYPPISAPVLDRSNYYKEK